MGTRADFYMGRGKDAEWLGSIPMDGYPDGIPDKVKAADRPAKFREAVVAMLADDDRSTSPEHGWPWPWDDSGMTDYAYAYDKGKVWAACFGDGWAVATEPEPKDWEKLGGVVFPDMKDKQKVTLGPRSGLIVLELPK